MRELVPIECQFDPRYPRSIGKAIASLFVDEEIRQASLGFGQRMLEKFTWRNAAAKMVETLERISPLPGMTSAPKRVAVFSCMPPDKSGIAAHSSRVFSDSSMFNIFSEIASRQERLARIASAELSAGQSVGVLPASVFRDVHELSPFAACLFVLGNSHHNLCALEAAIQSRGSRLNRCVYLHDGSLHDLWFWYCKRNIDRLIQLFSVSYNAGDRLETCRDHSEFLRLGYFGIRPLALLTEIKHFIVNSERAKSLVQRELGPDLSVRIDVVYHSIDPIFVDGQSPFKRKSADELFIGHFGTPDNIKGISRILSAAKILKRRRNVKIVLAGWNAKTYVEHNVASADRDNIIVIDAPSDEQLFLCMKWVDVAVQLRERNFGESSGVVSQLIGVGKRPIVTHNLIDDAADGKVVPVPNDTRPAQLADVIESSMGCSNHNVNLSRLSSENLGNLINRMVLSQ